MTGDDTALDISAGTLTSGMALAGSVRGNADAERPRLYPSASAVRRALAQVDSTTASAVSLMTGLSRQKLDDLGGFE